MPLNIHEFAKARKLDNEGRRNVRTLQVVCKIILNLQEFWKQGKDEEDMTQHVPCNTVFLAVSLKQVFSGLQAQLTARNMKRGCILVCVLCLFVFRSLIVFFLSLLIYVAFTLHLSCIVVVHSLAALIH